MWLLDRGPLGMHALSHSWPRGLRKYAFPISRSLRVTSGDRRIGISLRETNPLRVYLNEPMHIGMRLLHPAAADHSVSISRQQVQRIFSFLLRSRAVHRSAPDKPFYYGVCSQARSSRGLSCWCYGAPAVDCTHQIALPLIVLQAAISPVRFSTLREQFL